MADCMRIFQEAGADEFLEKHSDLCPEFTKLYNEKKIFLASGKIDPREAWSNHSH